MVTFAPKVYWDIRELVPGQRLFNQTRRQALTREVGRTQGKVIALVHPLYAQDRVHDPAKLTDNYFLQQKIDSHNYRQYLARLEACLRSTTLPAFIFTESSLRVKVTGWLADLKMAPTAVLIGTDQGDPTPLIGGGKEPWPWLQAALKDLGVSRVQLAGELYYREAEEEIGCLPYTRESLSNFVVEVVKELTYPNMSVGTHSRQ